MNDEADLLLGVESRDESVVITLVDVQHQGASVEVDAILRCGYLSKRTEIIQQIVKLSLFPSIINIRQFHLVMRKEQQRSEGARWGKRVGRPVFFKNFKIL